MNKTEAVARKILGWKLNRHDRWYDLASNQFIPTSDFQPEHNLTHALLIVEKLEEYGIKYTEKGGTEVCFDDFCATGDTLAQAITNAASLIADTSSVDDAWF
ncbi:hypothetical protein R4Z10_11635 [Niallia sp. XMNu-256]|uniref:BC1872 family protein n=1 Tax=Niallia sp. XMNu-256 TaxID=3082444 RepID=UPI0030D117F3